MYVCVRVRKGGGWERGIKREGERERGREFEGAVEEWTLGTLFGIWDLHNIRFDTALPDN